jgi:mannobiose 2-epimerase
LSPFSLPAFRQEVRQEYFAILGYWQHHSVDHANGGFHGRINGANRPVPGEPKSVVITSRILWTFSRAYRHFRKAEHLMLARRAYDYLRKHFVDTQYGGVYWSVTADGAPLETKKQVYGHAFAMYGLTEFYEAAAEPAALALAREINGVLEKHSFDAKEGGFVEAFNRDWSATDDYILSRGEQRKTMNTHLHLLEAYANFYRVQKDENIGKTLRHLIEMMLTRIIDPTTFRMRLFFDDAWQPKTDAISYGHDIEASWLLWEAAEILADRAVLEKCKSVSVGMAKAAADGLGPDHGMDYEYEPSTGHRSRERSWWVMAEAMAGFLNAHHLTGKAHFLEKSTRSWAFIKKHLIDRRNGEWFGGVTPDGKITSTDKITFWKGPYHNSRACLEVWHRL